MLNADARRRGAIDTLVTQVHVSDLRDHERSLSCSLAATLSTNIANAHSSVGKVQLLQLNRPGQYG